MNNMEQKMTGFLFEQLPRESTKAFAAFREYMNMGPQRSLAAVAAKVGKSKTMMERWSRRFDWPSRVKAQAAQVAEVERLTIERLAVENAVDWYGMHEGVRREAWKEAQETIAMVRKAREEWLAKGRLPGWEGMARMLELAFKLKQFAAGMPSEIKEMHTHVTGKVSVEWETAIRKAYGVQSNHGTHEKHEKVIEVEAVVAEKAERVKPEMLKGAVVVDVEATPMINEKCKMQNEDHGPMTNAECKMQNEAATEEKR
jgi:hypothetical protein